MVKNVRPGALAGNLQPLHPDEDQPPSIADATVALGTVDVTGILVPAGDLDARIAWVSEAADEGEAVARADAIWQHEIAADPDVDKDTLSAQLRAAVHGTAVIQVPGVEATADGTSEAVNADTGAVTQPGDPLPPIADQGGDPLPVSGDDSAPADPETTGDENTAQGAEGVPVEGQNSTGSDDEGHTGS